MRRSLLLAAVTGIDRDNDIALGRLPDALLHCRGATGHLVVKIEHQPVAGLFIGFEDEAAQINTGTHIQYQPEVVTLAHPRANANHRGLGQLQGIQVGVA